MLSTCLAVLHIFFLNSHSQPAMYIQYSNSMSSIQMRELRFRNVEYFIDIQESFVPDEALILRVLHFSKTENQPSLPHAHVDFNKWQVLSRGPHGFVGSNGNDSNTFQGRQQQLNFARIQFYFGFSKSTTQNTIKCSFTTLAPFLTFCSSHPITKV